MDFKKETFKIVDDSASAHSIIATNTSTMSITEFAKRTKEADRFCELH
jgi:3-hydroxyacyl-CoA dehydrogenase